MRKIHFVLLLVIFAALAHSEGALAQERTCHILQEAKFPAGQERVRRVQVSGMGSSSVLAIFKAPLAVNTDGAPSSYHPQDPEGERLAINRVDNGIGVSRRDGKPLQRGEKIAAFVSWRNGGYRKNPVYVIGWANVFAKGANGLPCIFSTGPYAGYLGSMTTLSNGLSASKAGECGWKNYLDLRYIPALALRAPGVNPLRTYGVRVGDLALAINPANGAVVPAIFGDQGDAGRIGEGSVALNMGLLKKTEQPRNYVESKGLDTGHGDIIVASLPRSASFKLVRPYTQDNINARVAAWAQEQGYGDLNGLASAVRTCAAGL